MTTKARSAYRVWFCMLMLVLSCTLPAAARSSTPQARFTAAGRLEARNYVHLSYALAAFGSQATLGYTLNEMLPIAARILYVPRLDGIDLNAPLTIHFLQPAARTSDTTPSTAMPQRISIVRLTDNGAFLFNALQAIYASHEQFPWGVTFTHPNDAYDWPYASVTVSLDKGQAFLSSSAAVIEWFVKNHSSLAAGHRDDGILFGTFTAAELASVLADIQPRQPDKAGANSVTSLFNSLLKVTLPHLQELDFTTQADGVALTFSASLLPQANETGAPILTTQRQAAALALPEAMIIPENVIYATIDARPTPLGDWLANIFSDEMSGLPSLKRMVHAPMSTHLAYLAPSPDHRSLVYASVLATPDPGAQLAVVTQALATASFGAGLTYLAQPERTIEGRTLHSFRMVYAEQPTRTDPAYTPAISLNANTLPLLLALPVRGLICEVAATDKFLAITLGPSNALANVLSTLESARPAPERLLAQWQTSAFRISPQAEAVSVFYPVRLFHNLVRVLPGSRAELVRRIPTIGDGLIAVRMPAGRDGRVPSLLRITANELHSLQLAFVRGQPIIEELLLMSAFQTLMIQTPLATQEAPADE